MGYYIEVDIDISIPTDKQAACLAAINALHTPEALAKDAGGGSFGGGKVPDRWYRWVNNPPVSGFATLEEAFDEWRYEAHHTKAALGVYYFTGEKLGDDKILYMAIAPFVNDGGEITITGEDGEAWGYRFRDGQLINIRRDCTWVEED